MTNLDKALCRTDCKDCGDRVFHSSPQERLASSFTIHRSENEFAVWRDIYKKDHFLVMLRGRILGGPDRFFYTCKATAEEMNNLEYLRKLKAWATEGEQIAID